jgi:parallel beta-helix repeat protein
VAFVVGAFEATDYGVRYAHLFATGGSGAEDDPWVTEGSNPIQAAYNDLPASDVILVNGYFASSQNITIPAGCTIRGSGTLSRVIFTQTGSNNIGFVNATNAGDIALSDFYLDHNGNGGASTNAAIQFTTGTGQNYLFSGLHIVDAAHSGIRIVGSAGVVTNVKVTRCSVVGAKRHGIEFAGDVTYGVISDNYCQATNTTTLGASIYAGSIASAASISVTGNIVKGSLDNGIRTAGTDITISGNTVISSANDGIRLAGPRVTCSGNTVRACTGQGIKAEDFASITVSGNTCTGCTENGIQVRYSSSQPSYISITGNTCSSNTLAGIHIRAGQDIVVSGNQCDNNAGNNIWIEAPDSQTTTRVHVTGNSCFKSGASLNDILISQTGGVPGTIGYVSVVGNVCDGGTTGNHGIGVLHAGTRVTLLDNICQNHSGTEYSIVTGVYFRGHGTGTGSSISSAPIKGSAWFQTDGTAAAMGLQVYDNAAWRDAQDPIITVGITASTTQSQGQGPLIRGISVVATVANPNDTVTLPGAIAGVSCTIINNGANTLRIYPASGDNLGTGVDTLTTLSVGSNVTFTAIDTTNWEIT